MKADLAICGQVVGSSYINVTFAYKRKWISVLVQICLFSQAQLHYSTLGHYNEITCFSSTYSTRIYVGSGLRVKDEFTPYLILCDTPRLKFYLWTCAQSYTLHVTFIAMLLSSSLVFASFFQCTHDKCS